MSGERADPVAGAVAYLRDRIAARPRVALVLGSGLGALADRVDAAAAVSYGEIPGFARSTVQGHRGRLVAGRLEGVGVLVFQGRYHAYEGHAGAELAVPVRTAAALGADTLIVTCAAGAVNPRYGPGDLMVLDDHINLMGLNPLVGPVRHGERRFPDMTRAYDPELRQLADEVARHQGIPVVHGVYAAFLGPSYETPAEIRVLERIGADAVGMSTVPEVIVARALDMRVLGIALLTNAAAGISAEPLDHEAVIMVGEEAADRFQRLVRGVLARL